MYARVHFVGALHRNYRDHQQCDDKFRNTDFGRRLPAAGRSVTDPVESTMSFNARTAPTSVSKIVMARDHFKVRATEREQTALKATLEAKRNAFLQEVESDFKSRVAKQVQSVCDEYTTVLYLTAITDPTSLANCTSLRELSIWNFDSAVVSALAPQLGDLKILHLFSVNAPPTALPENLNQLRSLETLEVRMSSVQGDTMPEVLRRMTGLTSLTYTELGSSAFTVPGWLSELTQLTALDLSHNRFFGDWPMSIFALHNLRDLSMNNANLSSAIPEEITKLKRLVQLDLSDNYNFDSPAFLGRLTHLRYLRMHNNAISFVPSAWGSLVNLRSLGLFGNLITCLPQTMRELPYITSPEQDLNYPACPEVPLPLSFSHARSTACLWDANYKSWYRAACDAQANALSVTLYADSTCRKKAKRRAVQSLKAIYPKLGSCKPFFVGNITARPAGYTFEYCQS
jgi:Leucine-rich repeat (LRR) protein